MHTDNYVKNGKDFNRPDQKQELLCWREDKKRKVDTSADCN